MNKGSWGKIRAFFDLQTSDGFTIKGFKLVEGINGLFVGFPSQKGNDDEYYDTVWADRDVKEQVNQLAIKTYGQEVMNSPSEMDCLVLKRHPLREISSPLASLSVHSEVRTSNFASNKTLKNFLLSDSDIYI